MNYNIGLNFALEKDKETKEASRRHDFHIPLQKNGEPYVYLCGNSLGLMPKQTETYLNTELRDWARLGVEGHFHAYRPWMPYHELLTEKMANVVGALPEEVVMMNTLSVNLHLMMVSFYKPTANKYKIIIESDAFPSDLYAVTSQLHYHGIDVNKGLIKISPREGEDLLREEDIMSTIEEHGDSTALILLGVTNYYTGQWYPMKKITELGHKFDCMVGFDCAHGVGNVPLDLHDTGADFAVWCTYKYLNSGPGSVGGCFIHQRHVSNKGLPRFGGWWGHDKTTRFGMREDFNPIPTAEGWQLSNPPILALAPVLSSLDIFDQAGIHNLRKRSLELTGYMEYLLLEWGHPCVRIITPSKPEERGSQLSIQVIGHGKNLFDKLEPAGIIADWRNPDVIRVAPAALYTSFEDVYKFVNTLKSLINA